MAEDVPTWDQLEEALWAASARDGGRCAVIRALLERRCGPPRGRPQIALAPALNPPPLSPMIHGWWLHRYFLGASPQSSGARVWRHFDEIPQDDATALDEIWAWVKAGMPAVGDRAG